MGPSLQRQLDTTPAPLTLPSGVRRQRDERGPWLVFSGSPAFPSCLQGAVSRAAWQALGRALRPRVSHVPSGCSEAPVSSASGDGRTGSTAALAARPGPGPDSTGLGVAAELGWLTLCSTRVTPGPSHPAPVFSQGLERSCGELGRTAAESPSELPLGGLGTGPVLP